VLRGGLTNKHIDVGEVLKHVKCEPTHVQVLKGEPVNNFERIYNTTAPDFQLSMFELRAGEATIFSPVTAEIILLTEGTAELSNGNGSLKLELGHPSAIVFPGREVKLSSPGGAVVFRASVPLKA
jgi:mannose-6-phosphate isomerase